MRLAALVLTAGRSRRMGRPKAWLELDGEPLLVRIVRVAALARAEPIVVVVGSETPGDLVSKQEVVARLPAADVAVGVPEGQPIDSVRAGLARIPHDCAVLLWPVDHPFAGPALLDAMLSALGEHGDRVVVPDANGRWGHPVLLGPEVAAELRTPLADHGAHRVVSRDPARIRRVAAEPRVAAELNTPEQALALGLHVPPV